MDGSDTMPVGKSVSLFSKTFTEDVDGLVPAERLTIASEVWPTESRRSDEVACTAFFEHLTNELIGLRHHREEFAIEHFQGIVDVIRAVKDAPGNSLADILQELSQKFLNVDEDLIQRSLELSVRVWLTLNVDSWTIAVQPRRLGEQPLTWEKDASLADLIEARWEAKPSTQKMKRGLKIDDEFTAAYLVNTCGMALQWTEYLSDHLSVDQQGKVLTVYKHKVYLSNALKAPGSTPIPNDVLEEALDTLVLLFPWGDAKTKALLQRHGAMGFYQLGNCSRRRELDIHRYGHWREEIETLIGSFNRPPRTWKQLATDQRNLTEWAMFWVTFMVAALTLVSIPCNIVQATFSVKAYHATVAQARGETSQ